MKRDIIRVGDRVRIVNPDIFIRCGYPLTKEDILRNYLKKEDIKVIENFLAHFEIYQPYISLNKKTLCEIDDNPTYTRVFDRVADAVAYGVLSKKGFGGRERKIYTEFDATLSNATATVIERKVVNTGNYEPGWYDSYGGDGEMPSLTNQKSHVIFEVLIDSDPDLYKINLCKRVWVEKINLEKI